MIKKAVLFSFFLVLLGSVSLSQDRILKLNGRSVEVKKFELKGDWLYYVRLNDEKEKLRKYDKYDIFSVQRADGTEEIIYDPDTLFEQDPSVAEVRSYIQGEQHGMATYKKPWNKVGGAAAGVASGFAGLYGPIGVFAYTMVVGRVNPKTIPISNLVEPEVFNSEEFKSGYRRYARNKKIRDSLIFGGIGFVVGFTVLSIAFHD